MKFRILNIFLLLLSVQTFSQDRYSFDWNGKSLIDSLKKEKIDSIYTVKSHCTGVLQLSKNDNNPICDHKDWRYFDLYVFWIHNGEKFVKKFNNCFEYEKVQLDSIGFLKYYNKNRKSFVSEKIKSAKAIKVVNDDIVVITYDVDDYCKLDLSFAINNRIFRTEIYDYNFETDFHEYYGEQNRRLKLFTLYNLINSELNLIESNYSPEILRK